MCDKCIFKGNHKLENVFQFSFFTKIIKYVIYYVISSRLYKSFILWIQKNQGIKFCLSLKLKQQSIIINNLCKKIKMIKFEYY